jgi:hypothetical protein
LKRAIALLNVDLRTQLCSGRSRGTNYHLAPIDSTAHMKGFFFVVERSLFSRIGTEGSRVVSEVSAHIAVQYLAGVRALRLFRQGVRKVPKCMPELDPLPQNFVEQTGVHIRHSMQEESVYSHWPPESCIPSLVIH